MSEAKEGQGEAATAAPSHVSPIVLDGTVEVKVTSWERRTDSDSEWVVFQVQTIAVAGTDAESHFEGTVKVWRRFSDFELLRLFLATIMPSALLPPLPEKSINFKLSKLGGDRFDPDFLEKRRAGFDKFLLRLQSHPRTGSSSALYNFLKIQKWGGCLKTIKDGTAKTWAPPSLDAKMSKLMSTPKQPHRQFLDYKHYGTELKGNMTSILNTHARFALADHTAQRNNNSFAIAFSRYGEIETENTFGELYHEISEYFDELAEVSSESIKKEETLVADPLKEFVFYADSVKELIETQEYVQCKYESTLNETAAKRKEIHRLEKPEGISGFFRSLGTPDKAAEAAKKERLEGQLKQLLENDTAQEKKTMEFNDEALDALKQFDKVKAVDMRENFQAYGTIQLASHKKKLASWKAIKDACQKVRRNLADAERAKAASRAGSPVVKADNA